MEEFANQLKPDYFLGENNSSLLQANFCKVLHYKKAGTSSSHKRGSNEILTVMAI